jgi:hypothetical protein
VQAYLAHGGDGCSVAPPGGEYQVTLPEGGRREGGDRTGSRQPIRPRASLYSLDQSVFSALDRVEANASKANDVTILGSPSMNRSSGFTHAPFGC